MTPDRTYGDRYAIVERVGTGGMAEVYRARDELLGRDVAVKVLSERLSSDRSFVERFRREAQAAANLSHPNIVSLYDYGADDGTYFIVMEYIDGRSLDEVIKQDGPLLPERAAEIAADVARALERAHTQGLVHRDVKPSNIMITSHGQTKVTDFGIVRALGTDAEATMTQTGMVIGTAAYLSPEQAHGAPVDARSDVYALGCVLYEMLTGRPPFTGDSPLSIAYKHVRENAQPPSSVNSDVPAALDAVTMKALAKNPDNRYQSAVEMREDLERFTSGQTVRATPLLAGDTMVAGAAAGSTQVISREEYADEGPERRRGAMYVVIALAILGLFALVAWLLASNLLAEKVPVPRVVGLEEEAARNRLEARGFEVEVDRGPNKAEEGVVYRQDPRAREEAAEGSTVTIFVSEGPRSVVVPDLQGMTEEEAADALEEANLVLGDVEPRPVEGDEEIGTVIEQDPAADEEAPAGSKVDVVIAAEPETVVVPYVIGQSQESAENELVGLGLQVDVTFASDDAPEGTVIAQDPEEGAEVEAGSVVVIGVSSGPEEQSMPNVIGQDGDEAEAQLESELGLNVSQEEVICEDATPPGVVCDQDPAPGEPVSEGDDATLFVQTGDALLQGAWFAFFGWLA